MLISQKELTGVVIISGSINAFHYKSWYSLLLKLQPGALKQEPSCWLFVLMVFRRFRDVQRLLSGVEVYIIVTSSLWFRL